LSRMRGPSHGSYSLGAGRCSSFRWGCRMLLSAIVAFTLACGVGSSNQVGAESVGPPNVILISVDTLRADYVGCYGSGKVRTPNIDVLASDGTRFGTVVSEVPLTFPAHTSLLTGNYPMMTGVRDNLGYRLVPSQQTLAEVLKEQGYSTGAFVGAYVLHSKWGLGQGFDRYDDDFRTGQNKASDPSQKLINDAVERRGGEVSRSALNWIRGQARQPFFCWIHLFDPHDPYQPPEPYLSRYGDDPYAGEVAYADAVVGEILDTLRELNLYERSLVVLVGDHGESLGAHREMTHGFFLYDSTLLVPLIVKLPLAERFKGSKPVVDETVQLVDVFPTVVQALGLRTAVRVQGKSQLNVILGKGERPDRAAYSETFYPNEFGWSELKSWRTGDYKYILGPHPELYNLHADPGESRNLLEEETSLANRLRAQLETFQDRYTDPELASGGQVQLSDQDLARFRSLGYVGGPSPGSRASGRSLPDPKGKIEEYDLISQSMTLIARGEFDRALSKLEELKRKDPDIVSVDSMIGQCYLETGRLRKAQEYLQRVVKDDPSRTYPLLYLAEVHFRLKEYQKAQSLLEEVIRKDPESFQALSLLGIIYDDQGETARSIEVLSKAVAIQDDAQAYQMLGLLYTKEGQPREAAHALEKAVELEPDNALVHLYLANAFNLLGQRGRAEEAYRKALALDPSLKDRLP